MFLFNIIGPGRTFYDKECRYDSPCAKYQGKEYYWCYTDFEDNWEKCSPAFDWNEKRIEETDFDGNFGISTDEKNKTGLPVAEAAIVARIGTMWPGYPYVYRVLGTAATGRMDEGTGLDGINSLASKQLKKRPNSPYWDILEHVAFNPEMSSLISTTTEIDKLKNATMKYVASKKGEELYIVKIDLRQLK